MSDWTDRIVGERMVVDQEFNERVQQSRFSSQEWGLIMTATKLEIENPGGDDAELVANTENLPEIMPELEKIRSRSGPMGGAGPDPDRGSDGAGLGGLLDSVRSAVGLGDGDDGVDEERLRAARALTEEYASELQRHLESKNKWSRVQTAVHDGDER